MPASPSASRRHPTRRAAALLAALLVSGFAHAADLSVGFMPGPYGAARPAFIVVEPDQADCLFQSAARGQPSLATGTVDSVTTRAPGGIAVIDDTFSRQQLADLHAAGVRGVRINLEASKQVDVSLAVRLLRTTAETLGDVPLIIQLYAALPVLAACASIIATLRQQVLIDHFGLAKAARGREQEGFDALLDLIALPRVWMKLSGPYQISDSGPAYPDIEPVARALLEAAPSRVVWGSDWPHTGGTHRPATYRPTDLEPFRQEDDVRNLDLVRQWTMEPTVQRCLLADNPTRLFDWD